MSRGIILSLLRFTQPHFLKPYVKTLTCNRQKSKITDSQKSLSMSNSSKFEVDHSKNNDDPNIAFLSSSMNNILVCGILKGIHLSMINFHYDPKLENLSNKKEKQKINFKSIEILDPKIFEQFDMDQYNQAKMS